MKFIEFEPGDATKYFVGFEQLEHDESLAAMGWGWRTPLCLFVFGTKDKLHCGVFPLDSICVLSTYCEYVGRSQPGSDQYTVVAGCCVLNYLLGQDIGIEPECDAIMSYRWTNNYQDITWKHQLDELLLRVRES